ncbi:MAG: hypothetical protein RIS97_222 [Pseudomonadota bacterium]
MKFEPFALILRYLRTGYAVRIEASPSELSPRYPKESG